MENITEKIIDNIKSLNININDTTSDFITENNIDSITFIEIILNIEEEFSILIPEEYLLMEEMNTVSKISLIVQESLDSN